MFLQIHEIGWFWHKFSLVRKYSSKHSILYLELFLVRQIRNREYWSQNQSKQNWLSCPIQLVPYCVLNVKYRVSLLWFATVFRILGRSASQNFGYRASQIWQIYLESKPIKTTQSRINTCLNRSKFSILLFKKSSFMPNKFVFVKYRDVMAFHSWIVDNWFFAANKFRWIWRGDKEKF